MREQPEIILELSRLLSRVLYTTPSGIDRVEAAYARGLHEIYGDRLAFAAVHPAMGYGRLSRDACLSFLDALERLWADVDHSRSPSDTRRFALRWLMKLLPHGSPRAGPERILIQASPHHLDRPNLVSRVLRRERARFVCLIHDLIPVEYPEYARPGGSDQHRRRMETVARFADGVLTVSHATLRSFEPFLAAAGRKPRTAVAHLGTLRLSDRGEAATPLPSRPYFVCVGTIEPRKNHLLLLHVWRAIALRHGAHAIPKLVVIGRRGWENEQVVDMLERCPALSDCVEERNHLPDSTVSALVRSAQALLLPSFAEGFGMPVTEALELGVPVLCSDLPALREAGGPVPEFLDPIDGQGWTDAVLDYARNDSERRYKQLERLALWRPPTWRDHMAVVQDLVHRVAP